MEIVCRQYVEGEAQYVEGEVTVKKTRDSVNLLALLT